MSASASKPERRVRYLVRVLRMNPAFQAEQILELRSAYLGRKSGPTSTRLESEEEQLETRRTSAARMIERVRQQFWQMPLNDLRRKLAGIELDSFPDLRHAATRLQIAADSRDVLPNLAQHRDFDPNLFSALKTVLVSSPRDVGPVKEKFRRRLHDSSRRKRAARMVRLLRKQVPEIYELEEDWLESIARFRAPKAAKVNTGSDTGSLFLGPGCLTWFFIMIALRLIRMLFSQS